MKLDLLTNATVVDDAIRFVSAKTKDLKSFTEGDKDEPDYDEDKDQLEEEQEEGKRDDLKSDFLRTW